MLGKNILAVYPHRKQGSEVRFFPPMGLEYVMAAVKDLVEHITIVDMRFEDDYDLARFVDDRTDSLCVSINWPPGFVPTPSGLRRDKPGAPVGGVIPELDLINRIPRRVFTVVGGRWASTHAELVFAQCPGVDVVVLGDGEETIRDLATARSLAEVEGIAWRDSGVVRTNPPRRLAPISETLFPDRALRRYVYSAATKGIDFGITVDSVMSSHGCPFHCKFCAYNADFLGRRRAWQPRSPESVVAELKTVSADVVYFADNNFCVDMARVGRICDLIVREGIRKTFALEARIDIAKRPDVLAKMARAGFRIIFFGIESASDESLRTLTKGFTIADVRGALRVMRRFPFFLGGFFIVGNIGESERDMRRIAPFAKELGLSFISLSYLRADRGGELEDIVKRTPGYHIGNDARCRVWSDRLPPRKLRRIKRAITRDFFLSSNFLRGVLRAMSLGLLKPRHLASILGSVVGRRVCRKAVGSEAAGMRQGDRP